jgi:hypothetical protein
MFKWQITQKEKQWPVKTTQQTKDEAMRTPLKSRMNSGASQGQVIPAPQIERSTIRSRMLPQTLQIKIGQWYCASENYI